jgi:glycosyltransferase involved in cell wall biosynthesis
VPPLVSIVVPCYNAAAWVDAALESALAQTHPRVEIIVVDDGSTDETWRHLERFRDRGVRTIRQNNGGASSTRNRALALASGDYIQYLDADDLLAPDKIARQLARLAAGPDGAIASAAWGRFTNRIEEARFIPEQVWRDLTPIDFLVTCALDELMFPPIAWLIPRAIAHAAGPWNEQISLNDDGEYMSRVIAASTGMVFCADARVYYRSGNLSSYGSQTSKRAAESELRAWDSIVDTMMTLETSERVRLAAATGYQRIQATYYGRYDDIFSAAEAKERAFGHGRYQFKGGPVFVAIAKVFGWKAALRLRHAKDAVRRHRGAAA